MNNIFETYKKFREKLQRLGKGKQIRESYDIFEEYLNTGFYAEAALVALRPELKRQIPKEKIGEVKKGLLNIIEKLETLKTK